jgi:7-carboxy-7-deazaguanine synthase
MQNKLPIYETFYAFQGEGCHIGSAAYFIRTYGCPVKCDWCDSANTWKYKVENATYKQVDVEQLAQNAFASGTKIVVITGGEPTINDLMPITDALHKHGLRVHLETCGAYPIRGNFDWITVSPKWKALPLAVNLNLANEIKVIVENELSVDAWWKMLENLMKDDQSKILPPIWLQPEFNALAINQNLLNSITTQVKQHPTRYRAGVQLHKIYNCDDLDINAK